MLDIIVNTLRHWFWTDSRIIVNIDKYINVYGSFYAFVYLTFTHPDKRDDFNVKDLVTLDIKQATMSINIEIFSNEEVIEYFQDVNNEGIVDLNKIGIEKTTDFITTYGHGICDLICEASYYKYARGELYYKALNNPNDIITHVANVADKISPYEQGRKIETIIYLPKDKK